MPASVVEMANVAARYGGESEPIMVVQTLRVALTVAAAPFFVAHVVSSGTRQVPAQAATMSWPIFAMLAVAATIAGGILTRLRVPNC
jgi:uncharacterized membrane protein AbrB (regulator of aidB expression)